MKLFFAGLTLFLLVGCGNASDVEVLSAVQKLEDFKEVVQVMDISGPYWTWVEIDKSQPELQKKVDSYKLLAEHVVIYRTKPGGLRIATLNSSRPPKITALSQELKQ